MTMSVFLRARLQVLDQLRHSAAIRHASARWEMARLPRSAQAGPQQLAEQIVQLCRIARRARPELRTRAERAILERVGAIGKRPVSWERLIQAWNPGRIDKAVVLKAPVSDRERGVVLVSFEYQWARLMGVANLEEFTRSYLLVTAPTWSPPHAIENTLFPEQYPDKRIVTLISNQQDRGIFEALSPKFQVAPLYASSWVDSNLYRPLPFAEKDIDIVVLANFGTYKRHFALFEALRDLPRHLRVVLVGQPVEGRSSKALLAEADLYGVRDRLELRESVPDEVVVDTLRRSKISLILSMQEGSCVAVAEALIANTPTGVMENAVVGSKAFIHAQTGRLLQSRGLGRQLLDFLQAAPAMQPRAWMLAEGHDCSGSTSILNRHLQQWAVQAGEDWTQDIAVHHWRPDPMLLLPTDRERLRPAYVDIQKRFGLHLGRDIL